MSSAQVIYDAAQERMDNFMENYYEPSMLWLIEVHQNAIKLFNKDNSEEHEEVILPRTPAAKRKFVHVEKANCLDKESTFQVGSEFKKLKIDDCSTILECSVVNLINADKSANDSRSLRPRRQAKQNTNRQKRNLVKKKEEAKSIVVSHKFVPPASISNVRFESPKVSTPGKESNSTLQSTMNGSSNATVMRVTPHKTPTIQTNFNNKPNQKIFKKIQCQIDFEANAMSTPTQVRKDTLVEESPCFVPVRKSVIVASTPEPKTDIPAPLIEDTDPEIQNDVEMEVVNEVAPEEHGKEVLVDETQSDDADETASILTKTDYNKEVPSVHTQVSSDGETEKISDKMNMDVVCDEAVFEPAEERPVAAETKDVENKAAKNPESPKKAKSKSPSKSPQKPKTISPTKSGKSPPKKFKLDEEKDIVHDESSRRGTYKIMVDSIIEGNNEPIQMETHEPVVVIEKEKDEKKVQKVTKHSKPAGNVVGNVKTSVKQTSPRKDIPSVSKQGNLVTNIKSFVKQSPPKKEPVISAAKKAAELEKKELLRQNAMKEERKKKQQQIEEKRRLREEREKQMAEQQQKKLEENEKRRQLLEQKEAQIAKNQDEIRRARELEEKQKREARDAKKAELDARRQREEDEKRKKAAELLRGEKRKEEVILRKNEQDEKIRLKKKAEKEMQEKDKLRLAEEHKAIDEQRKKNLYEEKEKHRLDVVKKREEEREKERIEKQMREEKNRQAEKEISDAKKREEERQRAKEEERIRLKLKQREEMKLKYQHGYTKTLLDVQSGLRASPRLKEHAPVKYTGPTVPLNQRDSIYVDYGLDDLNSDDSTDDESQPAKRIPSWAVGSRLKSQLLKQFYMNLNPDDIFINCMEPLRLEKIFKKNKKIYFTRSSSAHWNSPPIKGRGYNLS